MSNLTIEDKKNTALGIVIKILVARKPHLITRLFENSTIPKNGLYGLWLCYNSAWTPVLIDDYVPVLSNSQVPAFLKIESILCNNLEYVWPLVLEKAISKICGGYALFEQLSIPDLFKILTGSNFVTFKIK